MASNKLIIVLVTLAIVKSSLQDIKNNHVESEDINPLAEAAAAILKEQNAQNIGGMVNNLLQSGGAKQLGDMLLNAATNENAGDLLQGLGSILGQGKGLDPSMLGAVMNLVGQAQKSKEDSSGGLETLLPLLGSFLGQPGNAQGIMDYLPMIMQTFNSFMGPEADERSRSHADHAWLLPPIVEKFHLMFDHFMNSDMGRQVIATIGAEKFVKIFHDETGKFSYRKFVEMLENHSFRRHWIRMVTNRIALIISYAADPKVQKKYLSNAQNFINSILKSQGYPKVAMFDPNKPIETITAFVNHFVKVTFNMKISAKQYVKPAVNYVQDLFRLAQNKGILGSGVDSRQLSDKLADTINMEVIEPIARVNRAYRFASKVHECDRYVMCLVNQPVSEANASLPGLKTLLSKSTSLVLSWFLSSATGTSFWSLYHVIIEENNCQARFVDSCNDFHLEEVKVTTEYVHNEL